MNPTDYATLIITVMSGTGIIAIVRDLIKMWINKNEGCGKKKCQLTIQEFKGEK